MGRFFGGMGGKGVTSSSGGKSGSGGLTSSSSLERAMAAKKAAEDRKKGIKYSGTGMNGSAEERYQAILDKKMEANKKSLMAGTRQNGMVGKQGEREKSKTTQATLDLIAQQMAKKQLKKAKPKEKIVIKPTPLGGPYGGFIDAKGRVTNAHGHQVLQIDLNTGKIKTVGFFGGSNIGKFDPKSTYCFYKIQKKIEDFNIKKGLGVTNMWGVKAGPGGQPLNSPAASTFDPSSIYGTPPSDNNGGGLW